MTSVIDDEDDVENNNVKAKPIIRNIPMKSIKRVTFKDTKKIHHGNY
jgi:hypothetical protein